MIKRKYFKKLFFIYFSIMLVYGLILSTFFIVQSSQSLEQQQEYNNNLQADQIVEYLDQRLWTLNKYTDTLLQDKDFADYVLNDGDYYVYTRLYNKLRNDMAVFTDIGLRISVTKWVDDFVITNQFTRNLNMFIEEMYLSDAEVGHINEFYLDENKPNADLIILDEASSFLHIIKKKKVGRSDYVLIMLSIDTNFLRDKMINNSFEFYVDEQAPDAKSEVVSVKTSKVYKNLHYMITHPQQSTNDVRKLFILGGLLMVSLLIVGYVAALLLAKRIYKPIGKVVSSLGEAEEALDEFAYIQNQTDSIVEANQSLREAIKEQHIDLKTKFLRDVVYGLVDLQYAKIGMNEYQLSWMEGNTTVAIVEMHEMDEFKSVYPSQVRNKMRRSLYTIIVNVLDMEALDYELVELAHNTYALILGHMSPPNGPSDLELINKPIKRLDLISRGLMEKILKAVEANEEVGIRIALGKTVRDVLSVGKSYDSAKAIIDFRQSYDQRALVTANDMMDLKSSGLFYYTLEQERDLYQAAINGGVEKIGLIFQRINHNNFVDRQLSAKEELNLMMSLATTYRRIEQKVDSKSESKSQELMKLENGIRGDKEGIEDLIAEFERLFKNLAIKVKEKTQSSDNEMSLRMVDYIHDHFSEDISLEEVATSLNISAGYFCAVFKKTTGSNFKSYLNQYRVEKAKTIISEDPMIKIKDLTLRVGYNNVNSFIRMFKKHEGISPGEYVKRNS